MMQVAKASRKYKCSICQQKYTKIEDIRAHIKATHLVHVTCPLCDKVFANRIELTVHKKLHFQAEPDHLFQQTESINQASEVEDKESVGEPSSYKRKTDDTLGNCREDKPYSSFPLHTSIAVPPEQQTQFPSSQDSINNPEVSSKFQSKELNKIVSPDIYPQQREEDINEYSSINSLKKCEEIPLPSSTKRIVCVPLGDHWKVTVLSVAPKETECKVDEVKCAKEHGLPVSKWVVVPEIGEEVLRRCVNKESQPLSKCHEESKTRADKCTNKMCLPLPVGDRSYGVIPCKKTKNVQMPNCIDSQSNLSKVALNTHLDYTKDDSPMLREYSCKVCSREYDNIASVQSHMKEAHVNHLICLICNEKFPTRSQYLRHSNSHLNGSYPLPEEIKNYNENSGEYLSVKTKSVTAKIETDSVPPKAKKSMSSKLGKNKEYKCKLCKETYFSVIDMRTHVKKVHLAGLTCTLCNKTFANKYSLLDHSKTHNSNYSNKNLKQSVENSDICLSVSLKNENVENETPLGEVSSNFNESGIIVNSVSESNSEGLHHENIIHKCDQCCLYFDSESPLKAHQKTHKNVLYKCGVCEFASFSKQLVIAHLSQECHSFRGDFNEDL